MWLVDGQPVDENSRTTEIRLIPVDAPAVAYGAGVFETLRVYRGHAFLLDEHLARLATSGVSLGTNVDIPALHQDWTQMAASSEVADQNGVLRFHWLKADAQRWQRSVRFVAQDFPPAPRFALRSIPHWNFSRYGVGTQPKSTSYAVHQYGKAEVQAGEEPLAVDRDGVVLECATANVFLRRGSLLVTPSLGLGILAGCTRAWVLDRAAELGFRTEESTMSTRDLETADEVFITSSLKECASATAIDGVLIQNGHGTRAAQAFCKRLHEEVASSREKR